MSLVRTAVAQRSQSRPAASITASAMQATINHRILSLEPHHVLAITYDIYVVMTRQAYSPERMSSLGI